MDLLSELIKAGLRYLAGGRHSKDPQGIMEVLTEEQANNIVDQSLADFLPEATRLTRYEFCSDCPRYGQDCFPCLNATLMIRVYLAALVKIKAMSN